MILVLEYTFKDRRIFVELPSTDKHSIINLLGKLDPKLSNIDIPDIKDTIDTDDVYDIFDVSNSSMKDGSFDISNATLVAVCWVATTEIIIDGGEIV